MRINRAFYALIGMTVMAAPAFGGGEALLTMDPDKKIPTFVDETTGQKNMEFISVNYQDANAPEPFKLVFEASFAGQYKVDAGKYTAGTVAANGKIEFVATANYPNGNPCEYNPPGPGDNYKCYVVKLKLENGPSQGSAGFQYNVEMGGGTIDPRLRPR